MMQHHVLFADDEEHLRKATTQSLAFADIEVTSFDRAAPLLKQLDADFDGVVLTDIRMPEMDGIELLRRVMLIDPDIPVIMATGHGDVDVAVNCIKSGAYDFIEKPWSPERLVASVNRAAEKRRLCLENRRLLGQVKQSKVVTKTLYGRSAPMQRLHQALTAVTQTDVDVLITGDTGTGKEVAARLLHRESARSAGPFVHINCAALPDALIESELFGHEIGAFPGAVRARVGKLEHARRGTLCLDEIDLLPLPLQAKLLDVLHNRTLTRLGSNEQFNLDIRVVALAKSDLETAVAEGRFRADLLYRLNVATLQMPRLNDRREDIPGLFLLLAAEVADKNGLTLPEIPVDHLNALAARDWPGNVRELRNEAERFVLGLSSALGAAGATADTLSQRMAAHEKALIAAAISANGGRLKETYESLGLSRRSLYEKMQRYDLVREDYTD
ncbi:sigma-54-dependent transcriptional regulator [Loktanella sp. S4079]|uniref:sigma-54-dependent transcriptional regulator n=1 Tax=Loktanella sp. S4079 TaxID=579483 RepID=UPI0005F9CEDA|nr:Fis family transcriptional regulator [Loktanella sp. S4079]